MGNGVLNPSGEQRNLRSTHLMAPTRILELIQEERMKHKEQQDTVSKLQQKLASMVKGEYHYQEGELKLGDSREQEENSGRSLEKAEFITGAATTEVQGKNNIAIGTGSVANGGEKNSASGSLSVVSGGLNNAASDTMSVIGGGEKNKCLSSASSVCGGSKNKIEKAAPFSFVGGGFKNKMQGEYGFIGGGEKNQVEAKWASVLGGSKNLAKGNYATAMGRNALANQNLCMAIGLQLKEETFVRANQVGDWVLRAERIELRVDGTDKAVVL